MLPILGFFGGFGFGWWRAGKRGGNQLDKLQYGAGHGIAFSILGLLVAVILARVMG